MRFFKKSVRGLSLFEIIISMVIFALVIVGIVNVFIVSRSYISRGRSRASGVELGRVFLEPLTVYINESSWDQGTNLLSENPSRIGEVVTINGIEYTPEYNVTNLTPSTGRDLRKVKVKISWNETSP
jgi:Tfp pilus assembly protein PilW